MKGLELAEGYFREYGLPMLEREFPDLLPKLAAGLIGEGSECLGYDDAVSTDHDFEPGFCLFLPDEEETVDRRTAFLLEKAYAKLPRDYMGYRRQMLAPVGGARHGVFRIGDYLEKKIGRRDEALPLASWFALPEQALLELTCGRIFFDRYGRMTEVRRALACLPEDVRRKKLAGHLLLAGQSGQYNFTRLLAHGEPLAAAMALRAFTESAMHCAFLIAKRYMPYYKWAMRALREETGFAALEPLFARLLTGGYDADGAADKAEAVERICALLANALCAEGLSALGTHELERQAYEVNRAIGDPSVRNLHVLYAV